MRINITVRHGKITENLQSYAEKEVRRLKKYYDGVIDCEIVLDYVKRVTKVAEIRVGVFGQVLTAIEKSDDLMAAIKQAVDKLERQLKKYKGRLRNFEREKAVDHIQTNE